MEYNGCYYRDGVRVIYDIHSFLNPFQLVELPENFTPAKFFHNKLKHKKKCIGALLCGVELVSFRFPVLFRDEALVAILGTMENTRAYVDGKKTLSELQWPDPFPWYHSDDFEYERTMGFLHLRDVVTSKIDPRGIAWLLDYFWRLWVDNADGTPWWDRFESWFGLPADVSDQTPKRNSISRYWTIWYSKVCAKFAMADITKSKLQRA